MAKRRGFSLIELMMVIALISILLTLFAVAGMSIIGTSREAQTKALMHVTDKILSSRVAAMEIANGKSPFYDPQVFARILTKAAEGLSSTGDKARVLAVRDASMNRMIGIVGSDPLLQKILVKKEFFRLHFPQTWAEAEYQLALNGIPAITSDPNSETESAEVLFFIITNGKVPGSAQIDQEAIPTPSVRDTDGNGRREIVDGWQRPVRFYRWPARLLRPNGLPNAYRPRDIPSSSIVANIPAVDPADLKVASSLMLIPNGNEKQDSLDPVGATINGATPDSAIIANDTHLQVNSYEAGYYLPSTFISQFVVSAGPDGEFGLEKPTNTASLGFWCKPSDPVKVWDNITSRKN